MTAAREVSPAREQRRGLALVLLSALGYGSMPILARLAYGAGVELPTLLFWRFLVAALLFEALAPRAETPGPASAPRRLYLLGTLFVANSIAYFLALSRIPVAMLTLLVYTYPVMATLLSAALGIDRLTPRNLLAAVLAFGGAGLAAGALSRPDALGIVLALASALTYSLYVVLTIRLAADVPSESAARHVARVALVVYLVWAAAAGRLLPPLSAKATLSVFAIGAFSTVVALRAFMAGLARLGPARAAVLGSFEVVVALGLAALFLGEPLSPRLLAGGALIVSAAALQVRGALAPSLRRSRLERRAL